MWNLDVNKTEKSAVFMEFPFREEERQLIRKLELA